MAEAAAPDGEGASDVEALSDRPLIESSVSETSSSDEESAPAELPLAVSTPQPTEEPSGRADNDAPES